MLARFGLKWHSPETNTNTCELDPVRHVTSAIRKGFKRRVLFAHPVHSRQKSLNCSVPKVCRPPCS
jgi:hypothetical protein